MESANTESLRKSLMLWIALASGNLFNPVRNYFIFIIFFKLEIYQQIYQI